MAVFGTLKRFKKGEMKLIGGCDVAVHSIPVFII